jgi:formylglycine-generating enzyme required for sulfatase activity
MDKTRTPQRDDGLISHAVVVVFIIIIALNTACVDFPELPPVVNQPSATDQQLTLDVASVDAVMLSDLGGDSDVDQMTLEDAEIRVDLDMDTELDLMLDIELMIPDMVVTPENFTLTRCENGVIVGSDQVIMDGQEQRATPLSCRLESSTWLRVDPVSDIPFYTPNPMNTNQNRDQGVGSITTRYTYFLMQSEVTYNDYSSECNLSDLPELNVRLSQASCRDPSALANENTQCASTLQDIIDDEVNRGMLSLTAETSALPMNCVTWEDAAQFCRRIGGRLPTEVEWEVAATYGRKIFPGPWPSDQTLDEELCQYTNIRGNEDRCEDINPLQFQLRPTCWGENNPWSTQGYELCDMSGNVVEWVLDDWAQLPSGEFDGSPQLNAPDLAPNLCPMVGNKVTRGGSANQGSRQTDLYQVYLTRRSDGSCQGEDEFTGFRCVISPQMHGVTSWTAP